MEEGFISLSNLTPTYEPETFRRYWVGIGTGFMFLYFLTYAEKNPKDKKTGLTELVEMLQKWGLLMVFWISGLIILAYSFKGDRGTSFLLLNTLTSSVEEFMNFTWSIFALHRILLYFGRDMETKLQYSKEYLEHLVTVIYTVWMVKMIFEMFGFLYPKWYALVYIIYLIYLTIISLFSIATGLKSRETFSEYVVWALVRVVVLKLLQILVLSIVYYNDLRWFEILIFAKKLNYVSSLLLIFADRSVQERPKPGRAFKKGVFQSTVGVVVGIPGFYPDLPRAENTPTNYGFWHERTRMDGEVRRF